MSEWNDLDYCNDGERHQWRGGGPDGMVCGGCGVSEAELDHLIRQAKRRKMERLHPSKGGS